MPPYFLVVDVSACAKASKILFCLSIGMPIPVSVTEKCSTTSAPSPFSTPACNTTSPRSVNLMAFPTRFTMIRPSRLGSPTRSSGMSGGKCEANSRPFSCARTANTFIVSATVSRNLNSTRSNSSFRASTFEKSRMSLIKSRSDAAEVFTVVRYSRCSAVNLVSKANSVMPTMAFIGVRISWLMFARNSLLARVASSAFFLAISSSFTNAASRFASFSCTCLAASR